jgi:hypothetical protein
MIEASAPETVVSDALASPPPEAAKPEKESSIFSGSEDKLRVELGSIFDKNEATAEQERLAAMPPRPGEDFEDTVARTYEWQNELSKADRSLRTDARNEVQKIKENAKNIGLELDDTEALKLAWQLEQQQAKVPDELAPTLEAVKAFYPDQPPHETLKNYTEYDRLVRHDPVRGVSEIIKQTGHDEREVLRQMAAKFSPPEWQRFYAERDANIFVEAFLASHSDANHEDMIEALGKIRRTGDYGRDLRAAYQMTKSRRSSGRARNTENKFRDSMSKIYDEARQR